VGCLVVVYGKNPCCKKKLKLFLTVGSRSINQDCETETEGCKSILNNKYNNI
jgi:hypothetical protein